MLNVVLFSYLQLHFVSYNTKYADILDALNHEDGLAVLGLFIQVTRVTRVIDTKSSQANVWSSPTVPAETFD